MVRILVNSKYCREELYHNKRYRKKVFVYEIKKNEDKLYYK